ncbi:MAG: hypothetical protein U0838_10020 [Chloroflexota bacterium]
MTAPRLRERRIGVHLLHAGYTHGGVGSSIVFVRDGPRGSSWTRAW